MRITEIYPAIVGESTHTGRLCVIVRFTGCSLRCVYCDTSYAFTGGENVTPADLLGQIRSFGIPLVLLTGGEPLEQEELHILVEGLLDGGHEILMETNGARPLGKLDRRVTTIMDIKCPGSGHVDTILWENLDHLDGKDEIKFVLTGRDDYEWAKRTVSTKLAGWNGAVLFSAVTESLSPAKLSEWIIEDRLPVRLQIQIHKVLWPDRERGV